MSNYLTVGKLIKLLSTVPKSYILSGSEIGSENGCFSDTHYFLNYLTIDKKHKIVGLGIEDLS